jgi:membrane-associated protein
MEQLVDVFLHLDTHLTELVATYGRWVYAILFVIIFAETGLVVTPILPGDSLLFAAGALAASGALDLRVLLILLIVAVGPKIFHSVDRTSWWQRMLNRDHLARAHEFFEKYGGKAIILGRFVPIVRTFVPFVAGAGTMTYSTFALYNVSGAVLWVGICTVGGYIFGNVPIVRDHFSLVAIGIVAVSLIPIAVEYLRGRGRVR